MFLSIRDEKRVPWIPHRDANLGHSDHDEWLAVTLDERLLEVT
jgi:hypothetical protein